MKSISDVFRHEGSYLLFEPDGTWILPKCYIGLEWEFELASIGLSSKHRKTYITIKEDGSLRDNGREYCFNQALFGKDLTDAIAVIMAAVSVSDPQYNVTNYRTGFHIHLDVRDLSLEEVHTLLMAYAVLEPAIFNLVGEERKRSNFCVPWFRCEEQLRGLRIISQAGQEKAETETAQLIRTVSRLERYSALNCNALAKFGSLEFRHFPNDREELVKGTQTRYIQLCMALKKVGQSGLTPIDIVNIANSEPPNRLITSLLGTDHRIPPLSMSEDEAEEALVIARELLPRDDMFDFVPLNDYYGDFPGWRNA